MLSNYDSFTSVFSTILSKSPCERARAGFKVSEKIKKFLKNMMCIRTKGYIIQHTPISHNPRGRRKPFSRCITWNKAEQPWKVEENTRRKITHGSLDISCLWCIWKSWDSQTVTQMFLFRNIYQKRIRLYNNTRYYHDHRLRENGETDFYWQARKN